MSDHRDKRVNADGVAGGPAPAAPPATLADRVRSLRLPSQTVAAPARASRLPWVLVAVLLLTSLLLGYKAFTAGGGAARSAEPVKPTGDTDAVAGSGDVVLESKGYIIPAHQIQVSPKVGGMVTELNIEEGKRVKAGDILAKIETDNYLADRDHAEAAVKVAEAQIEQAEASTQMAEASANQAVANQEQAKAKLDQAQRDWDRARRLGPTGALAASDFDTYKAAYFTDLAALRATDAAITQARWAKAQSLKAKSQAERNEVLARADLKKAQWYLDQCVVTAPITGTILTKKAEKGNIVNPAAFNVSASLCDMADLSDLEVDLSIQERDVAHVFKGQKCRVVSEAFPNRKPYEGYVSRLMPTADRAKGAVPVRVKLQVPREEEGVFLKPDMSVIVSFLKEKQESSGEAK
jgi:multidrug resistance efflux pump